MSARVVELATSTYAGFNRQHLTEMLAEHHGIFLSRPTVHRILSVAGVASVRHRRPARHRQRRDRYPREGMLLQVDGSRHDWLEGRGPHLTLIGGIDDATGLVPWACFREQEDAQGYFQLFREVVRRRGIPMAVYSDQHSIFYTTTEDPHPGGATHRSPDADPGRPPPRGAGSALDPSSLTPGQGPGGTPLGHLPGPPHQRTPTRRCLHSGAGRRGSRALPLPAQPPLQRASGGSDPRLAALAHGDGLSRRSSASSTSASSPMTTPSGSGRWSWTSRPTVSGSATPAAASTSTSASTAPSTSSTNGIQLVSASPPPFRLRNTRSPPVGSGPSGSGVAAGFRTAPCSLPLPAYPGSPLPTTHGAGEPAKITELLAGQSH